MKKQVLSIIALAFSAGLGAQTLCDPAMYPTNVGLPTHPDSAWIYPEALPGGEVLIPYDQTIYVKFQENVTTVYAGNTVTLTFDSAHIQSITGLPSGYSRRADTYPIDTWEGGDFGCVALYGTTTVAGTYTPVINLKIYATLPPNPFPLQISQDTAFSNFTLLIGATGTIDVVKNQGYSLYPNPASDRVFVEVNKTTSSSVVFTLSNLLGEVVLTEQKSVGGGLNKLEMNVSNLDAGVYIYSMLLDGKNVSGKNYYNSLMKFSFTVLGTGSALPTVNRHPSAYLLNANGRFFLIDCGEGTQMQLRKYGIKIQKIEKILISHLHGDHYFGLIGLLNTFQLLGREKKLEIYCPKGLKAIIELQLTSSGGWLEYPYQFIEWEEDGFEQIFTDDEICIEKFPLNHRIICCGYNVVLKKSVRNINIEALQKYQIPGIELGAIQKGADYTLSNGEVIPNASLTHPLPNPIKISYCSDTAYSETVIPFIANADLLFHESTFIEKDILKAQKTNHSTAIQAATIAKKAQVKKLIIGHFSARYIHVDVFEKEARSIFENTYIAHEGETYE